MVAIRPKEKIWLLFFCCITILLSCTGCSSIKAFWGNYSDGSETRYNEDYYDDGYIYGDDGARDDFQD
ncbi:MAG: hypothetical protein RRX93_01605 [Bacteroidales bacterium]